MKKNIFNILLIEDDHNLVSILKTCLESDLGSEWIRPHVVIKEDGKEAVDYIHSHLSEISMILLDIMLPHVDGMTILEDLYGNEQIEKMPVIVITAINNDEFRDRTFSLGVNNYFQKPFSFDQLMKSVRSIYNDRSLPILLAQAKYQVEQIAKLKKEK